MWRPENFKNPYGEEWFMSSCQHQYNLGEAYEQGFNDAIEALRKGSTRVNNIGESPQGKGIIVFIPEES